ncbi:glycosyltransferase family 9 protein [archaeon]|jgi:heptosyltransferase II|nr:glycosyltransferase family 9 protein [archaeon]MBT4022251.1 glycosyltransferase family 9 protein [archaeon]MBT4272915.1 glycosyltransferase family 9 protein [archaeon]MBT4460658.1 glycosyltransferase family 9 protein [archaeon]MBT5423395.1 glycosyltransferase family 9 protein [archaeon]
MIKLQRLIDKYIGSILIFFLSFLKVFDKKKNIKKRFLIIKLWAIGDSVISLVLIKAIKTLYNGAKVDVLIRNQNKDIFDCYPLDNIHNMDKKFTKFMFKNIRKYDVVIDCEPYLNLSAIYGFILGKKRIGFSDQFRSLLYNNKIKFNKKQHMVQNYLDMVRSLGKKYDVDKLEKMTPPKKNIIKIKDFLKKNKIKKCVGISVGVGGSAKNRMWYEKRFATLSDKIIKELKLDVVFIDSPNNDYIVQEIISHMSQKAHIATKGFDLKDRIALISRCSVFISNDSGLMHVGAAQGCRTIGLFGPNTPILWGPYGKNNIGIYKTRLPPSIDNVKAIFKDEKRMKYMGAISVNDVFLTIKKKI